MESLLCNEVWLMNPSTLAQDDSDAVACACFYSSKPDFEIFLEKESTFMPAIGYSKMLDSCSLISNARFTAVSWLLKSQRRMNLSSATVFSAVNYLDRFISSTHDECQGWKSWKFQLVSIACLSVASKFNESTTSTTPLISEFQQYHSFTSGLIQQMELTLLKTLDWRMDCTTPFSYIELLICSNNIDSLNKTLLDDFISQLLLHALLDHRFSEFRPSVIAMSAVRCIYENNASLTHLIPQEHMDDLIKCQKMMDKLCFKVTTSNGNSLSPVTVLQVEWYNCYDNRARVDLSLLNINLETIRKRKREEAD